MTVILAALDASPAARPVLEAAQRLARLTGATVEAVHVSQGPAETPAALAARAGIPFRQLVGPVGPALLDALADREVIAATLGARSTTGGRRPTGHTALHVLQRAGKPVLVVPPEAASGLPRAYRRLLVPLEGTAPSTQPIADRLLPLLADEVELLVLHVFTPATMPRVLDRPGRDLTLLGDEFLARHLPIATRIELRTGSAGAEAAAACRDEDVDLVVLSWAQDASPGHAAVIHDVLAHASVPVLLLPADGP